jgi:hypothetical protein
MWERDVGVVLRMPEGAAVAVEDIRCWVDILSITSLGCPSALSRDTRDQAESHSNEESFDTGRSKHVPFGNWKESYRKTNADPD